jgi:hypothetical protein
LIYFSILFKVLSDWTNYCHIIISFLNLRLYSSVIYFFKKTVPCKEITKLFSIDASFLILTKNQTFNFLLTVWSKASYFSNLIYIIFFSLIFVLWRVLNYLYQCFWHILEFNRLFGNFIKVAFIDLWFILLFIGDSHYLKIFKFIFIVFSEYNLGNIVLIDKIQHEEWSFLQRKEARGQHKI